MVKVAKELIEAVHRRQMLVAVAQMVLAELTGHIALGFQKRGDGRVFVAHSLRRPRQANLGEAGPDRRLPGDKSGTACGAALLTIIVGEQGAFLGNAVDVGGAVPHHPIVISADVELADIVAHDDEDVGPIRLRKSWQ